MCHSLLSFQPHRKRIRIWIQVRNGLTYSSGQHIYAAFSSRTNQANKASLWCRVPNLLTANCMYFLLHKQTANLPRTREAKSVPHYEQAHLRQRHVSTEKQDCPKVLCGHLLSQWRPLDHPVCCVIGQIASILSVMQLKEAKEGQGLCQHWCPQRLFLSRWLFVFEKVWRTLGVVRISLYCSMQVLVMEQPAWLVLSLFSWALNSDSREQPYDCIYLMWQSEHC